MINETNLVTDQPSIESNTTDEAALQSDLKRLSNLSVIEYERCRIDEARRLGIRPNILDQLVKSEKLLSEKPSEKRNRSELFSEIIPCDDFVEGEVLLDEIVSLVEQYIVCEKPTTHAVALWIIFTWCIDAMHIAPIACITAPEKRCGKTQLLNLIGMLCLKPLPASNITASALFRSIDAYSPTLLIDEADTFLSQNDEIRGMINSSHTRLSAFVIRTVGDNYEPKRFNTWSAIAISGIGQLSDTLKDRSIILKLRRKQSHEKRLRLRHGNKQHFYVVKRKLARWREDNIDALRVFEPILPSMLNDRAQDNWEPLLTIADQIGGHWPETARQAAILLSGVEQSAPSINEELLADIQKIFLSKNTSKILTAELLKCLCNNHEAAWATLNQGAPLDSRQMSKRLREFGVSSKDIRTDEGRGKGYEYTDFKDAFDRYIDHDKSNKAIQPTNLSILSVTPRQAL